MNELDRILQELTELTGYRSDPETDHLTADRLLCEAIVYLAGDDLGRMTTAASIVAAFEDISKWYA